MDGHINSNVFVEEKNLHMVANIHHSTFNPEPIDLISQMMGRTENYGKEKRLNVETSSPEENNLHIKGRVKDRNEINLQQKDQEWENYDTEIPAEQQSAQLYSRLKVVYLFKKIYLYMTYNFSLFRILGVNRLLRIRTFPESLNNL